MSFIFFWYKEKDVLMVATDDCNITAWSYEGSGFKTLNPITDIKSEVDIKILKSSTPQFCMAWDDI